MDRHQGQEGGKEDRQVDGTSQEVCYGGWTTLEGSAKGRIPLWRSGWRQAVKTKHPWRLATKVEPLWRASWRPATGQQDWKLVMGQLDWRPTTE